MPSTTSAGAIQRLIVLVLHNNDLNQVTWEQRAMEGDPKFDVSQTSPTSTTPGTPSRSACGASASKIPDSIGPAWEHALQADRPVVIDAVTDPEVPPLPPHITFAQAVNFAEAVAHGDSGRRGMITQSLRQKAQELVPGRR